MRFGFLFITFFINLLLEKVIIFYFWEKNFHNFLKKTKFKVFTASFFFSHLF
jgi:hypothetical protein